MTGVRIVSSARKHGIDDADIFHALRNPLRTIAVDDLAMVIGPARSGSVLEVGVIEDDDQDRVIHTMLARPRFWP